MNYEEHLNVIQIERKWMQLHEWPEESCPLRSTHITHIQSVKEKKSGD